MKKLLLIITLLMPFLIFSQTQIGVDIDGEAPDDESGKSVSISADGTRVAIGADANDSYRGHVRVYDYNGSAWVQVGADIDGEAFNDRSGYSVSLSANKTTVAIGAYNNTGTGSGAGHVRVFNFNGINWVQKGADINAEAFGDTSGWSVSLSSDGSIVAIGAPGNDGNGSNSGHVRVYNYVSTSWVQKGQDIDGEAADDNSGYSVSLSGDGSLVAIGAYLNDSNGSNSGHARVYNFNGTNWIKKGQDIDGEAAFDQSGYSVSLSPDGTVVAVGATRNTGINGANSGHVRVYNFNATNWVQIGADIDGEAAADFSGWSVSLSSTGNIVAIGARGNTNSAGHVRVYKNNSGIWNQVGVDIDGEAASDYSGTSVSLSSDGSIVAIGAYGNDNNGHVRVYNLSAVLNSNKFVLDRFEVYPNPTSTQFSIQLQSDLKLQKVNIYSQIGQFIKEETQSIIDVSKLSKGIYLVEIITNKGKATKKVIVN